MTLAAHYMLSLDFSLHLSLKDFFLYIFGDLPKKEVHTEGRGILRNCRLHEKVK